VAPGMAIPMSKHLTKVSRFTMTSGRSFLSCRCGGNLLYVADLCEHAVPGADDDLGAYHSILRWFHAVPDTGLPAGPPCRAGAVRVLPLLRRAPRTWSSPSSCRAAPCAKYAPTRDASST
jgi:hypothetical protein